MCNIFSYTIRWKNYFPSSSLFFFNLASFLLLRCPPMIIDFSHERDENLLVSVVNTVTKQVLIIFFASLIIKTITWIDRTILVIYTVFRNSPFSCVDTDTLMCTKWKLYVQSCFRECFYSMGCVPARKSDFMLGKP